MDDRFRDLLESKNVTMMFLVPHASHLAQPLDPGIFGRVKTVVRDRASYALNDEELNDALDDNTDQVPQAVPPRPRVESGKLLAEFILKLLRSFDQATTPDNVVSAFAQVGIRFRMTDGPGIDRRACYVDPRIARVVMARFGPIPWVLQGPPESHRLIKISSLNSGHQSALARQLRQELAGIRAEVQRQSRRGFEKEN